VRNVAPGVRRGVVGDTGDGALHVKHQRVRPGRVGPEEAINDHVDDLVGDGVEIRRLPVVVPSVRDGVIGAPLEVNVRRGSDEVDERRPESAECF
jgi:hypothetical protein